MVRDYANTGSPTGCGTPGVRTCTLVDEDDVNLGTETATTGPSTSDTYSSLSGNVFDAVSGFFYEDYYWDQSLTSQGGVYLDQFNGHQDEDRGYHYHLTTIETDGSLAPSFPYTVGPRFYGQLQDDAFTSCSAGGGGGMPGGGPPPGFGG